MGSDGFEAFYRAGHPSIVRALAVAFGDRSLAEESAQVGFERAYARWGRVGGYDRPATWIYVVAVRHGWRQRGRLQHAEASAHAASDDVADAVAGSMHFGELLQCLPPRQREAVVLRYLADLPLAEIATAQRVSIGTVKASLHAALRTLRVHVDDEEGVNADANG